MEEAKKYASAEEFIAALKKTKVSEASNELVQSVKLFNPDKNGVVQYTKDLTDLWHKSTNTPLPAMPTRGNPTPIEGTSLSVEDIPF